MRDTQTIDDWYRVDTPPLDTGVIEQNAIARRLAPQIFDALTEFNPDLVELFCDVGLPWIQVCYKDIVSPDLVRPIGEAIDVVTASAKPRPYPVLFQALRPRSIYYVLNGDFMWRVGDAQLDAGEYGVALEELGKWSVESKQAEKSVLKKVVAAKKK